MIKQSITLMLVLSGVFPIWSATVTQAQTYPPTQPSLSGQSRSAPQSNATVTSREAGLSGLEVGPEQLSNRPRSPRELQQEAESLEVRQRNYRPVLPSDIFRINSGTPTDLEFNVPVTDF
jgi:hypothetical protein